MSIHKPRKRFGQNFLVDDSVIQQIIHLINPTSDQHFVEIGPGTGALTSQLCDLVKRLDIVEIDRDLAIKLQAQFQNHQLVNVHQEDALTFAFEQIVNSGENLRVIGNLPYNISSPLLFRLLGQLSLIEDMHFMLQKEVVERMAAGPGGKDYGRLTIMVQYHCAVESILDVPPQAFKPPPQVNSAFVRLTPHESPPYPVDDIERLNTIVTAAFSKRRKTIQNAIKPFITAEQLQALDIEPTSRPEQITLEQYVEIANY